MNYESKIKDKIKILQPENLSTIHNSLFNIHPDFFIVAAYAKILSKEIIEIPRLGTIGVHPSLLPKYRGASPIQSVILNGEKETGVTLYLLDDKMDRGKIVSNIKYQISGNEDYKTLEKRLAELGGNLLAEILPKFLAGEIKPITQKESEATFTRKFSTEDAFVNEKILDEATGGKNPKVAGMIYRKILALTPEPGVWTPRRAQGRTQRVKLLEAELGNGKLVLKVIQNEGQKPVKVQ